MNLIEIVIFGAILFTANRIDDLENLMEKVSGSVSMSNKIMMLEIEERERQCGARRLSEQANEDREDEEQAEAEALP